MKEMPKMTPTAMPAFAPALSTILGPSVCLGAERLVGIGAALLALCDESVDVAIATCLAILAAYADGNTLSMSLVCQRTAMGSAIAIPLVSVTTLLLKNYP